MAKWFRGAWRNMPKATELLGPQGERRDNVLVAVGAIAALILIWGMIRY